MSDNATLSDIFFARQLGRFRLHTVVISAAVGYDSHDDSRRARPLRTPAPARLGAPRRVFVRQFGGRCAIFRRCGARRARFPRKIRPAWAGAWRRRLALKSAAAVSANLLNRREDEAALRDAIALAKPGQELGPAGRVYAAFRALAGPGDLFRPERLAAAAADLQAPLDG